MRFYELTYLISPMVPLSEAKKFSENITDWIKKEGGVLSEIKNPLKRKLSYQIKKEGEAFLTSLDFYLDPASIENLSKKIKSEEKILRALCFAKKPSKKIEAPKILKVKKEEKVSLEEIEKKLEEILGEK